MTKQYTADDVSDEVENLIKSEVSEKLETWTPLTYKSQIAINWNHSPERITWRWERNEIYVGLIKVAKYHINITFRPINLISDFTYKSLIREPEARQACEKIADEFIKSLTAKQ
jgi:hypothetical protein